MASCGKYPCTRLANVITIVAAIIVSLVGLVGGVQVQTPQGTVEGFVLGNSEYFLGIPFAEPPIGSLRWAPPVPKASWGSTVLNASQAGPFCPQRGSNFVPGHQMSEDCLYLNIITPQGLSPSSKIPVMVWIYGGSYDSGEGAAFDGTSLVDTEGGKWSNVIFVSFNYRVGPFGFLAHPSLQNQPGSERSTGFYGILDQILALKWVQSNIAAFGGDPTQVTLFGESAGAISVCLHTVLPESAGLFQSTIYESAFCDIWELETGVTQAGLLGDSVGCSHSLPDQDWLNCIKTKDTKTIIDSLPQKDYIWFPVVDGIHLTGQPSTYLASGKINPLTSALVGTNNNEASFFGCTMFGPPESVTEVEYPLIVGTFFGPELVPVITNQYPLSRYAAPIDAVNAIFTDLTFRCGSKLLADALASHGINTYMYSLTRVPSFVGKPCYKAAHTFEMPFLYTSFIIPFAIQFGGTGLNAAEMDLSVFMRTSWTAMAATGTPNVPQNNSWPVYDKETAAFLELDTPIRQSQGFLTDTCAFWAQHPCKSNLPGFKCQPALKPTTTSTTTATTAATSSNGGDGDGDGLSDAGIVGVVMGSVIGACFVVQIIVVIIVFIIIRRMKAAAQKDSNYKLMAEGEENL